MSTQGAGDNPTPNLRPQVFVAEEPRGPSVNEPLAPLVMPTVQAGRIVPQPVAPPAVSAAPPRRSLIKRLAWSGLAAAFAGWLVIDLYLWVVAAFSQSTTVGWLASAAVATGTLAAFVLAGREIRSYFAFREVETLQKRLAETQVDHLRASELQATIGEVLGQIPRTPATVTAIEAFQRQIQRHHTPAQQIELLSRTVMAPLDERAQSAVRRASARAFGITAISPTALTDAVFFVATSIRMVREVAGCYGHRPTALATARLLRRLIADAGRLGAVDLAGAALTQHIGGAIAERVAAGAAESVYATQRMARLGLVTMWLCRPVPFGKAELPSIMSSLVGGLFSKRSE